MLSRPTPRIFACWKTWRKASLRTNRKEENKPKFPAIYLKVAGIFVSLQQKTNK
jgi:hypothetical protein